MKIKNVEQRSKEWFQMRLGVITGSRVGNIFKANNVPFIYDLLAEKLSGDIVETPTTAAMMHGVMMEPVALDEYRMRTGADAREIGFVIHDEHEWLAISPDALVFENDVAIGGVEIKCPSTKKHIEYIAGGKVPAQYKHQVMHYFIVIDTLQWMDFVSFDPRISKNFFKFRIHRNDPQIEMDLEMRKMEYLKFWDKLKKYERKILS